MNSYIASQLQSLAETLSPADYAALAALYDSGGLASVTSLDGLPSAVQTVVRNAFLDGVRWSFVSLVPWLGVGCVLSVFLSRIVDSDGEVEAEGEAEVKGGSTTEAPTPEGDVEARAGAVS